MNNIKKLISIFVIFAILSTTTVIMGEAQQGFDMQNIKIADIQFANNIFVAVGRDIANNDSGIILYSTDGRNWTKADTPPEFKYHLHNQGITYHNAMGKFLVVRADEDNKNLGLSSSDGIHWENVDYGVQIYALVYDGARLLANSTSTVNKLAYNSISETFPLTWETHDLALINSNYIAGESGKHIFSNGSADNPSVIYTSEFPDSKRAIFSKDFGATMQKAVTTQCQVLPLRRIDYVYLDNKFITTIGNNSIKGRKFGVIADDMATIDPFTKYENKSMENFLTTMELGENFIFIGNSVGNLYKYAREGFDASKAGDATAITGTNKSLISDIACGNGVVVAGTDTGLLVMNESDTEYEIVQGYTINPILSNQFRTDGTSIFNDLQLQSPTPQGQTMTILLGLYNAQGTLIDISMKTVDLTLQTPVTISDLYVTLPDGYTDIAKIEACFIDSILGLKPLYSQWVYDIGK